MTDRPLTVLVVGATGSIGRLVVRKADRRTLELVATDGPEQDDLTPLFAALTPDVPGPLDGAKDAATAPLAAEPQRFRDDLAALEALRG